MLLVRYFAWVCAVGFSLVSSLVAADKPADFKSTLPRLTPKEPAEALKTFSLLPGFRMELLAAEPLLRSPVALDFDEDGRLFVAEYPEYNQYANPKFKEQGAVRLLEDTNGDGKYDKSTLFADKLDTPVAVFCYDGGVFVGSVPHLLYLKDTDGDGKADVKQIVLTGFARDHAGEAMLNSFRWGLENRIHISTNLAGGNITKPDDPQSKPISVRGQGILFDPKSRTFELTSGGGQHGMSMDDFGRKFVCENSNPVHALFYDTRYLSLNPYVQAPSAANNVAPEGKFTKLFRLSPNEPWRVLRTKLRTEKVVPGSDEGGQPSGFFTGATGITVYRGDGWPAEYRGNLLVGEVSGNLVYRAKVTEKEKGIGLTASRADADREFLASTDNWFRPVQCAHGPDGNLYVIDMYRELIEGAAFLPPQILQHMDVSSGLDRGRIYRLAHEKSRGWQLPKLSKASSVELVSLLEHPNGWHSDTAARLLYQRQDRAALASLRSLAEKSASPLGRVHALHALQGMQALQASEVVRALSDPHPRVREQALRLAEQHSADATVRNKLVELVNDPDTWVRYQLAFTLGRVPLVSMQPLVQLAERDGEDAWCRLALLTSSHQQPGSLFATLLSKANWRSTPGGRDLLSRLAAQIGASGRTEELVKLMASLQALPAQEQALSLELLRQVTSKLPAQQKDKLAELRTGQAGRLLATLLKEAREQAVQANLPVPTRVSAVRTLGLLPFAETQEIFASLLTLQQPLPIQQAVLETLAGYDDAQIASFILKQWKTLTPTLRATAAETLFSRPSWLGSFLDALDAGQVKLADVEPSRLQLLRTAKDDKLRARVDKLLALVKGSSREEVVAKYQPALELKGDVAKGRAVFRKTCVACHRLEGVGETIGAELAGIRERGTPALLLHILDPNREVKPHFLAYVVSLKSGRSVTGMILTETATSLSLRKADGSTENLLRVQIDELVSTGQSFMPEGLEKQIDHQAMADLLAYLNSIK